MTVYASFNPTALRAGDASMLSDPVTILAGSNVTGTPLVRGTILGKITTSGKYTVSTAAANDGSQNPIGVLAADVDAGAGDVTAPVYFSGEFADVRCVFGAGHSQPTVEAILRATNSGIFIRKVGAVA